MQSHEVSGRLVSSGPPTREEHQTAEGVTEKGHSVRCEVLQTHRVHQCSRVDSVPEFTKEDGSIGEEKENLQANQEGERYARAHPRNVEAGAAQVRAGRDRGHSAKNDFAVSYAKLATGTKIREFLARTLTETANLHGTDEIQMVERD